MSLKIKKIAFLLLIPFLITGCFGSNDEEDNGEIIVGENYVIYEGTNFSITVPQDWETVEKDEFTSNVPLNTVVGFRNNIKNEIFTANVNISQDNVQEGLSAADFAKSTSAKQKTRLIAYNEIGGQNLQLGTNDSPLPAYLLESEGKKSPSDPIVHFKQLFVTSGEAGFLLTATYLPDEDESVVNYIDQMLNSFALK